MNNQVIVPIAVTILIAIFMAIAFFNGRDKNKMKHQLRRSTPKKQLTGAGEEEKQTI